ncbi:MAG: hypothetical protein K0R28_3840 [Paenibacillus sp.]|nr:hypothetical protein [Paenibacillus sp.]
MSMYGGPSCSLYLFALVIRKFIRQFEADFLDSRIACVAQHDYQRLIVQIAV